MEPVWRLFPSPVRRHSRQDASKRPRTGFCNGFYTFWSSQNDPQTILKRSSNARVLVFARDCASFDMLKTILKRSSNDPQMPTHWSLQWILHVLKFSERSSNDPQTILKRSSNAGVLVFAMDPTSFDMLKTMLTRSSNDPRTILKRWSTVFCKGFCTF